MKFDNSFGFSFPPMFMLFGGLLIIIAFVLIGNSIDQFYGEDKESIQNGFILLGSSLPVSFLGLTFLTSMEGVEIDLTKKKYRNYSTFIGIKKGKWKSLEIYTQLSILKKSYAYNMSSRANLSSNYTSDGFCVYLLDDNHWRKLLIHGSSNKESALSKMEEISIKMNLPIAKYKPKRISARR